MNMLVSAAVTGTAVPVQAAQDEADYLDWPAILERAERMVEILRTRVIHDRWRMDEETEKGAERLLRYCQARANGIPDDEEEWHAVINFLAANGQSIDWLLSGNPLGMICSCAKLSVVDPANVKMKHDPVFAAIEQHKKAYDALSDCLERQSKLESNLPKNLRESSISVWETKIVDTDDPRWISIEKESHALSEAEEKAASVLLIDNLTAAGAVELLQYAAYRAERGDSWPSFDVEGSRRPLSWETLMLQNVVAALAPSKSRGA